MHKLWRTWLERRFIWQGTKQLQQKDVLIFLDRPGYVYLILIVITFIAGVNYANNLILGFCFLITALLCVSFYIGYKQLQGLEIEVSCAPVGQVGENLEFYLHLRQLQPQTRYLYLSVGEQQLKICFTELKHQERIYFSPTQRGKFYYPNLKIRSVYPFGLVQAWSYVFFKQQLYSWVAPVAHFYANSKQKLQQEAGFDEFQDLKSYQIGDSLTHVAWKQLARGQGMYIKQFEPHQSQHEVSIDYAKMPAVSHEEKLSLMMGLVKQYEQQQQAYSVKLPQQILAVAVGPMQLQQAKRLLAEA